MKIVKIKNKNLSHIKKERKYIDTIKRIKEAKSLEVLEDIKKTLI